MRNVDVERNTYCDVCDRQDCPYVFTFKTCDMDHAQICAVCLQNAATMVSQQVTDDLSLTA